MSGQKRVILWAWPRTLSTAFYRAIINGRSVKGFNEPLTDPYYYGPEKINFRYSHIDPEYSFHNINLTLEKDYPEYKTIFVKEMAYHLVQVAKEQTIEWLPKAYAHSFIIRSPKYSIPSLYKAEVMCPIPGNDYDSSILGLKESFTLFSLIQKITGDTPVVIDAADILENPEGMLKAYCSAVDIDFHETMLNWTDDPSKTVVKYEWGKWYFRKAVETKTFVTPTSQECPETREDLPQEILDSIEENMKYYDEMRKYKLSAQ